MHRPFKLMHLLLINLLTLNFAKKAYSANNKAHANFEFMLIFCFLTDGRTDGRRRVLRPIMMATQK